MVGGRKPLRRSSEGEVIRLQSWHPVRPHKPYAGLGGSPKHPKALLRPSWGGGSAGAQAPPVECGDKRDVPFLVPLMNCCSLKKVFV